MPRRYLFGPVSADFADQMLHDQRQAGLCRAFNPGGSTDLTIGPADSWQTVCARLPADWRPDFIILHLPYTCIPACLWAAPVPVIGLAAEGRLLWHHYRRCLKRCDLVLTDPAGARACNGEGLAHVLAAPLFGLGRRFLEDAEPEGERDIDVLFMGNLHPAVQRGGLPWLGRLARFGERKPVAILPRPGIEEYHQLLHRARIVFHQAPGGEGMQQALEAMAAGALLFQEAGNQDLSDSFQEGTHYVAYRNDNLEGLLEQFLTHEEERQAIAAAAKAKAAEYSFGRLWENILGQVDESWQELSERSKARPALGENDALLARTAQLVSGADPQGDPTLVRDLAASLAWQPRAAPLHNALGLAIAFSAQQQGRITAGLAEQTVDSFRRAVAADPAHVVAGLNLAEALVGIEQKNEATAVAKRTLAILDRLGPSPAVLDGGHFPPAWDHFRVEWERAAWQHSGQFEEEARAKVRLLRWRLHSLLAELTDDLAHHYEAILARPDLPPSRAALGYALARAGRMGEAASHLGRAVADNPFDPEAARALYHALGEAGNHPGERQVARDRQLLAQAAFPVVANEPWFSETAKEEKSLPAPQPAEARPVGAALPALQANGVLKSPPRVSLCLIVKDEEANLPACLGSVASLVQEIIVVDTGSTDATKEVATRFGAKVFDFPWVDSFAAARNESLRLASGDWIFWLDADDRLDEPNRDKLRRLLAGLKDENAAYAMKCLCLPDGPGGIATVVDHVRLFQNRPELRWQYRVHEQILPALRQIGAEVRWADVVIHHTGYQDRALRDRKLQRDFRLLQLEDEEHPDDAFTLFNLGSVMQEQGKPAEALPYLGRSLHLSLPRASIVRKLYALIAQCYRQRQQRAEALDTCRQGRVYYPEDAELLFVEALLLREQGQLAEAEACLLRLLAGKEKGHFASVDAGLRGYKGRYHLATVYQDMGRAADAEAQYRAVPVQQPAFLPAWLGLADLYLAQQRWADLDEVTRRLAAIPQWAVDGAVVQARGQLARKDFPAARQTLEAAIEQAPQALWPKVILSHVLLQEGQDWVAAEQALRAVLALNPSHGEAQRNLAVLLKQQRRVDIA